MSEKIEKCPFCGRDCFTESLIDLHFVGCACEYSSPTAEGEEKAITIHNILASLARLALIYQDVLDPPALKQVAYDLAELRRLRSE